MKDRTRNVRRAPSVAARRREPTKRFVRRNERQHDLINKKFSGGLSPDEEVELERLRAWVEKELDRLYPINTRPLEKLLRRAQNLRALVERGLERATRITRGEA